MYNKKTTIDQMGQEVTHRYPPETIISLVPSQTEFLFSLGLESKIVGITKFCIHPKTLVKHKKRIGGTKNFKPDAIARLQPDLIVGNKEENEEQGIRTLKNQFPVWMSDISTLSDAYAMMQQVGAITGKEAEAKLIVDRIKECFQSLEIKKRKTALYFIWREPYMLAAGDTFINDIMLLAGYDNLLVSEKRYPALEADALKAYAPECVLLSSEPFPFTEKHFEQFSLMFPTAEIKIVDGEMFSWYGSRLLQAPAYLQTLI